MSFRRATAPVRPASDEALTAAMAGIGMAFAARPDHEANIEDTVLFASRAGMAGEDLRTLAVLVTWLGVHSARLNAARLVQLVRAEPNARVRAFWSAVARWKKGERGLAPLAKSYRGPRIELLAVGNEFQIQRAGEDARFAGGPLRVPANVLRDRPGDVLSPRELAARHAAYRWRVVIGPSYRADAWAALEKYPSLTAASLARQTYSSFATAWQVRKDFGIVLGR